MKQKRKVAIVLLWLSQIIKVKSSTKKAKNLSDAEMILEGLKKAYLEALPDRCSDLELLVLTLDDTTMEDYNEILRHIHSIKGSAGTYGVQIITKICHHFENRFEKLKGDLGNITTEFINRSINYIDLIRLAGEKADTYPPDYSLVEKELEQLHHEVPSNKIQVLIVESSASMAMIYKGALSRLELQTTMVSDGLDALGLLLSKKYDFVITSKAVKSLNGAALISALRMSETANSQIKIILLSSSSDSEFRTGLKPDYLILKDSKVANNLETISQEIINTMN